MKEKKYIDRIYQEKFKDFEAAPSEAVWKAISAKLREEEKNRKPVIAPLWYRLAGVAAVLAFFVLIGNWIFPFQPGAEIVNQELETEPQDPLIDNSEITIAANGQDDIDATEKESKVIPLKKGNFESNFSKEKIATVQVIKSEGITSTSPEIKSSFGNTEEPKNKVDRRKSLMDAIAEKEEAVVVDIGKKNFEVSTHAAPIYYGNFGSGNFLDPKFNNNSSEGEITYSYGVNIAYVLSDKLKIRSGVSKVNMSYNTNGVSHLAAMGNIPIAGVDLKVVSENQQAKEFDPVAVKRPFPNSNRSSVGNLLPGSLNQQMGYIEIPVELEYNLINNRFELNVIGGASTLFLDENQVSVSSGDVTAIGTANNLNQISFSTNIGLGLDYNISEKFTLNMEPILKYQLNTFSDSNRDSQPFYLGIYSGFSFKF